MRIELPQLKIFIDNVEPGANLLTLLSRAQVPVARSCGGDGVCGTCRLYISGESIPEPQAAEKKLERKQSSKSCERFACLINVPNSSKTWVIRADYW